MGVRGGGREGQSPRKTHDEIAAKGERLPGGMEADEVLSDR